MLSAQSHAPHRPDRLEAIGISIVLLLVFMLAPRAHEGHAIEIVLQEQSRNVFKISSSSEPFTEVTQFINWPEQCLINIENILNCTHSQQRVNLSKIRLSINTPDKVFIFIVKYLNQQQAIFSLSSSKPNIESKSKYLSSQHWGQSIEAVYISLLCIAGLIWFKPSLLLATSLTIIYSSTGIIALTLMKDSINHPFYLTLATALWGALVFSLRTVNIEGQKKIILRTSCLAFVAGILLPLQITSSIDDSVLANLTVLIPISTWFVFILSKLLNWSHHLLQHSCCNQHSNFVFLLYEFILLLSSITYLLN